MANDTKDKKAEETRIRGEAKNVQNQMNACENRIQDYDAAIRRLKNARDDIDDLKNAYKKNVIKPDKATKSRRREWTGSNYDTFSDKMEDVVSKNESYHKKTLDAVQDKICDRITELENARRGDKGLWNKLSNKLNSLWNELEKLFN